MSLIGNEERDLILSVNSGSSSLKITLFSVLPEGQRTERNVELVMSCSLSSISSPPVQAKLSSPTSKEVNKSEEVDDSEIKDHKTAFDWFLNNLNESDRGRIKWICHRVVHGGDYDRPVLITKNHFEHIESLSDLAPLHNGPALGVVKACVSALRDAKSIAYFDSTFHRSIPPHISSYAIDLRVAKERGLKKYGFHGISYSFVLKAVSKFLNKPSESLNLIILHLGSGASACAIQNGQSFDTSMGLTPVQGLPGATRSGAIDPSLIFHYTNKAGKITHQKNAAVDIGVTTAEEILNKKAGWKSMTGTTDFGEIVSKAELSQPIPKDCDQNPHRLAYDLFLDRLFNYIGAYHLKLGCKVDALVFAGGIGEKSKELRVDVAKQLSCLGYQGLDEEANEGVGEMEDQVVVQISKRDGRTQGSSQQLLVCRTDEQFEMADDCISDPTRFMQ